MDWNKIKPMLFGMISYLISKFKIFVFVPLYLHKSSDFLFNNKEVWCLFVLKDLAKRKNKR